MILHTGGFAVGAHAGGDATANKQRQGQEQTLDPRGVDFGAKRQIALVIGAQRVAMHDQDFTAIEVQSLFFGEQDHPALAGKALADEKIAVAMDEVARHAGVDDGFDCRGNLLVQRVRIVIADPCLKQIAKDIQSVRLAGFAL